MAGEKEIAYRTILPDELVALAKAREKDGNIGIAFTYNEPLVGYEYVRDCAALAKENGLYTVLVTNGMICEEPWVELLPLIDAANIDLKGFSKACYEAVGGDFETVKRAIALAAERIHVEVTTLVVPGMNDDTDMMCEQAQWLAGLKNDVTLHVTRFFPMYRMRECAPTPLADIEKLVSTAKEYLPHVYKGNC
jgi:pyruvate formate lyase activating enzyme